MGFAPALRPEGVKGLSPGVLTPGWNISQEASRPEGASDYE